MRLFSRRAPVSVDADRSEVDCVLADCKPTTPRRAAAKADTWHRLRLRVLEIRDRRSPRLIVRWPALVGYACAVSLVAGALFGWVRRMPVGGSPTPEQASVDKVASGTGTVPAPSPPFVREGWRQVDLGRVGQLMLSASASLRLPPSEPAVEDTYSVTLESGELCAAIAHRDSEKQGPFVVEASSLRVIVVGTRFCVSSGGTPDLSWVSVEDGRVRVERDGRSAMVNAGEVLRGSDPALVPQPSSGAPPASAAHKRANVCASSDPLPVRRRCLWQLAGGEDLAAQNALYMLGLLARDEEHDGHAALSIWQTYRHRFSRGAMMAEIDLAMLKELTAETRFEEVVTISDQFLGQFPDSYRAGEIRLKRADILRSRLGRPAEAEAAYRVILSSESTPNVRAEALYGLGLVQEASGKSADARSTWERYRKDFPQGRRASEVAQRISARPPDR